MDLLEVVHGFVSGGPQVWLRDWSIFHIWVDTQLREEKNQRGLINVYKYLIGENEEGRDQCFSVVTRARGDGHKLNHVKIHQKTRQHFFYYEVDQMLTQVAQSGCEVSFCGDIYTVTGHGATQPAVAAPALGGGLD